jgi:hypothetical protein
VKDDPFGVEFAEIDLNPRSLSARGIAIASAPTPYRLEYTLETTTDYITSRLLVTSRGEGWRRRLDLRRNRRGRWNISVDEDGEVGLPAAGGRESMFDPYVLDCDLGLSPVTNLMPVLRHDLLSGGGPVEVTTAWVSVPDLGLRADGQRYRFVRADDAVCVIRYEASDGSFAADVTLDRDGLVIDYPGIARRLAPASSLHGSISEVP